LLWQVLNLRPRISCYRVFPIGGIHGKFPVVIFAFEMGLCLVYQCHLCKSVVRFIPFGLLSAFIRANQR
jgi:hypothetical protein